MTATFTSQVPATDKQLDLIKKLIDERSEALAAAGVAITEYQLLTLSKLGASRTIDKLFKLPKNAKAKSSKSVHPGITPGMYLMDTEVIKVIPSQKDGRLYVAVLKKKEEGVASSFVSKGQLHLLYKLTPEHRMTAEQASCYGSIFGRCACCGKLLTVPLSVERGVGPVCWDEHFA